MRVDIAIAVERAGVKGWSALASEVRATAQGSTEEVAKAKGEREVTNRRC